MSAVKQHEHEEVLDYAEHEEDERRSSIDSASRDRRVIPRLGHPELRKNMRNVARLCTITVLASVAYIAGLIVKHLHDSNLELNRSIFFGVVIAIVAASFAYLGKAIRSYVENESQQRMIVVSERLFKAFFLLVVTGLILAAVNVITWF
jgi:predicted neutral ceramidase superfamily lipid hydrolase